MVSNSGGNTVTVLIGVGDGTFGSRADYPAGSIPSSVAIGDLDGNGTADVAVTDIGSDRIAVLRRLRATARSATVKDFPGGPRPLSVVIGDFDRDGIPDLASCNVDYSASSVSVLRGLGDANYGPHVEFRVGVGPYRSSPST